MTLRKDGMGKWHNEAGDGQTGGGDVVESDDSRKPLSRKHSCSRTPRTKSFARRLPPLQHFRGRHETQSALLGQTGADPLQTQRLKGDQ